MNIDFAKETLRTVFHKKAYSAVLFGEGGWGKNSLTQSVADEEELVEGRDYVFAPTHLSPAKLYSFINDNLGKVLILDDADILLKNQEHLRAFKDCLWPANGKKRILRYSSNSAIVNLPEEIDCSETHFILLYNSVKPAPNVDAVLSRCMPKIEVDYSFDEKKAMILAYAKKKGKEYDLVAKELVNNLTVFSKFTFRSLEHAFALYKNNPKKFKENIKEMLGVEQYEHRVVKLFKNFYGAKGVATSLELKKLICIHLNLGLRQAERMISEAIESYLLVKLDDRERGYLIGLAENPEKVLQAKVEQDKLSRLQKAQQAVQRAEERALMAERVLESRIPREFINRAEEWLLDKKNKNLVLAAEQCKKKQELKRYIAREYKEGREPDQYDILPFITTDCDLKGDIDEERGDERC